MILGGFQYSRWYKNRLETPTPQIMNPSKNEFLRFVSYEKLVAFFWNFGLHVDITLSVTFTVQNFPNHGMCFRSPMQWRPSNRKLSVCLTGNEINKASSNIKIDCWTLDVVLFLRYIWILSTNLQIIARRPWSVVVIFKTKYGWRKLIMLKPEVWNC